MKERLKKEATAYAKLNNIRKNIQFTGKTKIKISKSGVPSMLFGWAGAQKQKCLKNLQVFSLSLAGDDDKSIFTALSVNTVLELER